MSEVSNARERQDAAVEAAQNVVEEAASWEYSAERETIEARLEDGLQQAGVELDADEQHRLVDEIDAIKRDETRGAPDVRSAEPVEGSAGS